jgi:hypothetical protein
MKFALIQLGALSKDFLRVVVVIKIFQRFSRGHSDRFGVNWLALALNRQFVWVAVVGSKRLC